MLSPARLQAALLSIAVGAAGVGAGLGIAAIVRLLLPGFRLEVSVSFALAALAVSFAVGLASGVQPARRAAALDPVEALHAE